MLFDDKVPVTFNLPDGDSVSLVTWAYITHKLNEELTPIVNSIDQINKHLTTIDTKLGELTDAD